MMSVNKRYDMKDTHNKMNKKDLKVGMRVFVIENGKNVDMGTVIEIEDGFVSMVEGDEGFGYEMDSVEFELV